MEKAQEPENKLDYRPLGVVKELIEEVGAEVSYVYEDLIFIKHNHFLLQFGKVGEVLFFYANDEMEPKDSVIQYEIIKKNGAEKGLTVVDQGRYILTANENEELTLKFLEKE